MFSPYIKIIGLYMVNQFGSVCVTLVGLVIKGKTSFEYNISTEDDVSICMMQIDTDLKFTDTGHMEYKVTYC